MSFIDEYCRRWLCSCSIESSLRDVVLCAIPVDPAEVRRIVWSSLRSAPIVNGCNIRRRFRNNSAPGCKFAISVIEISSEGLFILFFNCSWKKILINKASIINRWLVPQHWLTTSPNELVYWTERILEVMMLLLHFVWWYRRSNIKRRTFVFIQYRDDESTKHRHDPIRHECYCKFNNRNPVCSTTVRSFGGSHSNIFCDTFLSMEWFVKSNSISLFMIRGLNLITLCF